MSPHVLYRACAVAVLLAVTEPRSAKAQVDAGEIRPDMSSSAPILEYSPTLCDSGTFGEDYGVDQACFYEHENYQGGCVCVGAERTEEVVGAFRLPSSEVGSVRVAAQLAVNVVIDDFKHEIQSHVEDSPLSAPCNYFVVAARDSVCVFPDLNFFGDKTCATVSESDDKFLTITPKFQSLMFVPEANPSIKAEIREGAFVWNSANFPTEMENGGTPSYNGSESFNFSELDKLVAKNAPYTKLRVTPLY